MSLGTTNGTVTSASTPSQWSTFFGNVSAGLGEGLAKIGSEIVPNWAKTELEKQSQDQLKKETYSAQQKSVESAQSKPSTVLTVGTVQINWQVIAIAGLALIGGLLLLKFVR